MRIKHVPVAHVILPDFRDAYRISTVEMSLLKGKKPSQTVPWSFESTDRDTLEQLLSRNHICAEVSTLSKNH